MHPRAPVSARRLRAGRSGERRMTSPARCATGPANPPLETPPRRAVPAPGFCGRETGTMPSQGGQTNITEWRPQAASPLAERRTNFAPYATHSWRPGLVSMTPKWAMRSKNLCTSAAIDGRIPARPPVKRRLPARAEESNRVIMNAIFAIAAARAAREGRAG